MNLDQRNRYFGHYWPTACEACGWRVADEVRRRETVLRCMAAVRGPAVTTSHLDFGEDEVTALFCYLDHLAHPSDLECAARWVDCQQDYHAYNLARQSDWHERRTYGRTHRLRQQFGRGKSAAGEPLEPFDPAAIRKRHMTMANRHRAKVRKQRVGEFRAAALRGQAMAAETRFVAVVGGERLTGAPHLAVAEATGEATDPF